MAPNFLYLRVYESLRQQILEGTIAPGQKLAVERDLATEYGVSAITIKKAMNMLADEGYVQRIPGRGTFVRDLPAKLPKPTAQPLIGVILEHVASPFGLAMMYELDRLIGEQQRRMVVRFSYCLRDRETEEIGFLRDLGVEGLIIMPSHGVTYNPEILKLVLSGFPVILVDKNLDGIDVPSIRTNNAAAMRDLVLYLAGKGHNRVGLVDTSEGGASSTKERREGFYAGIRDAGLPIMPECVVPFEGSAKKLGELPHKQSPVIERMTQYLLKHQASLDALVLSEYGLVPKLMYAAASIHLNIRRHIELCCMDEDDLSPTGFTFTHMKQDESAIARHAVSLLIARIHGEPTTHADVLIPALFREANLSPQQQIQQVGGAVLR